MVLTPTLNRIDVETARDLCGTAEIVVLDPAKDQVIERFRLLRYAGPIRGKDREAFAVKNSADKFLVRSDKELGLSAASPFQAFLASDFDGEIDLR